MQSPTHVAASPDGQLLAASGQDGDLVVWSPQDNRVVSRTSLGGRIHRIGWSKAGNALFVTIGGSLQVRSSDGSALLAMIDAGHDETMCFAAHPSQPLVATAGWKGPIRLWEVPSGAHARDVLGEYTQATAVAMSETLVVVGYAGGNFKACTLAGEKIGAGLIFNAYVSAIAAAPDGLRFVTAGGKGRKLEIQFDGDVLRPGTTWTDPPNPIATNWIEFAPHGAFVTAQSDDTATCYRDTNDTLGTTMGTAFYGRGRKPWSREFIVSSATFVPAKSLIATSHFSGCIKLWAARACKATLRFTDDRIVWDGVDDPVTAWAAL